MKQSIRNPFLATLALASLAFVSVSAHAADQVWNNSGATPDWNTADDNWGEPPTKWLQGNHAIFGGNGETVTLTEGISAGGITFTAGGYTITGNTLTLADGATITTAESVTAIINSALGGSGAIAKSGGGTLTLGGANGSYTGAVTVAAGRLQLNSTGALGVANAITLGAADGPANPAIAILAGVPDSAAFGALTVPASVTGAGISLPQNSATRSYSFAGATLNSPLNISQSNAAFPNWSQLAFTSKITGPGAGSGNDTLVLGNTSGMQTYFTTASGVAHDFSGNIRVLAGLIAVQSGNAGGNAIVPDTAMITINSGATWRWNGGTFTETVDGLAGAGAIGVNAASYNLTIHANNPDNEGRRVFAGSMANPAGTLILGGTGTQEFSGGNPNFSAGTSLNNGTLRLTNTINWNSAITFGATDSPKLQLNAPAPGDLWTFAKQVAGGSANASIEKTGDGKVTVTDGGSSFAGKLLVQAGTLAINATVGDATVADGTTLEGGAGGSGSLTAGAVTLGAATTDKVTLVGTLSTNPAYRAFTVNNLTIHGGDQSVTLDAGGAGLVSGTAYDLLVSANPITAPNASSVLAAFKSNSRAYAPVLAAGNTKVQLFYDANAALYWVGTTGAWNTTSTLDWKLTGNNAFTEFRANDTVFFRDNPVSAEVEIADADVTPLATVFENTTATDYAVYGAFGIASGSITKTGNGHVTLENSNPTTGGVNLNGGIIELRGSGGLGTGPLGFNGGTLLYDAPNATWNRNLTVNPNGGTIAVTSGATLTNSGPLSGAGVLTKDGEGTFALGQTAGTIATPLHLAEGTLNLNYGAGNVTCSGPITGSAGILSLTGTGASGSTGLTLTANNTFSGETHVFGRRIFLNSAAGNAIGGDIVIRQANWPYHGLTVMANEQIANTAVLRFEQTGGAYDFRLNGKTETLAGIASIGGAGQGDPGSPGNWAMIQNAGYDGGNDNNIPAGKLIVAGSGTYAYYGQLRNQNGGSNNGPLSFEKAGTGTQLLSGSGIRYTGATTVNGGVLKLANNTTFASAVTIQGGTFEVNTCTLGAGVAVTAKTGATLAGDASTLNGTVTIEAGATVAPGIDGGIGTLTAATATLAGTYQCQLDGAAADRVNVTGALTVAGGSIAVAVLGAPTEAEYIIATYGAGSSGLPTVTGVPTGYSVNTATEGVIKLVQSGGGFAAWAAANAPGQTLDMDHDKDGLPNGIEYFMGVSGSGFTANPAIATNGAISWPKGASYTGTYGTDYVIQTSPDLDIWTPVPQGNVTIDSDSVDYTLPKTDPKKFTRLKVTGP